MDRCVRGGALPKNAQLILKTFEADVVMQRPGYDKFYAEAKYVAKVDGGLGHFPAMAPGTYKIKNESTPRKRYLNAFAMMMPNIATEAYVRRRRRKFPEMET